MLRRRWEPSTLASSARLLSVLISRLQRQPSALSGSDASATSIGFAGALNRIGNSGDALEAGAWIKNSDVDVSGAITVDAVSNQDIDADVDAGVVSISASAANPSLPDISLFGLLGLIGDLLFGEGVASSSLSAGGVYAENAIHSNVTAYLAGAGTEDLNASNIALSANDTSTVDAKAEAVAIGAALSITSSSPTVVGVSIARNLVDTDVSASLLNAKQVDTSGGSVIISATDTRQILAEATAAGVSVGLGFDDASALSGGGAYTENKILGTTRRFSK